MNSWMMMGSKRERGRKERKQTEKDKQQQQRKGMRDDATAGLVSGCCLVNLIWAPWPHGGKGQQGRKPGHVESGNKPEG